MYKAINGWTKRKIIAVINKGFKGKSFKSSRYSAETCLYRGYNGKKCAVGLFIPDNMYDRDNESLLVNQLLADQPELKKLMPFKTVTLRRFQEVHDDMDKKLDVKTQKETLIQWVKKNVK